LVGDDSRQLPDKLRAKFVALAANDPSPTVRNQLACTAKRLPAGDGLVIVAALVQRSEDASDTHLPLLLWWAIEAKATSDAPAVLALFEKPEFWQLPIVRDVLVERTARRYLADKNDHGFAACAKLLTLAPSDNARLRLIAAMESDLSGKPLAEVPAPLSDMLAGLWETHAADPMVTRFALKLGHPAAYENARQRMRDANEPEAVRLSLVSAVAQAARPDALPLLLELVDASSSSE